ncbi:MAG: DUF4190 domain-containing protein [Enterocloster sp.]
MMNNFYNKQKKSFTSSDRLATCSMISGFTGIIWSFLYLPIALSFGGNYPTGLIFGVLGILLAIMSRNADTGSRKVFRKRAVTGMIFSSISIGLTFFFFYTLICYYDYLRDPVLGPQINALINQLQQQIEQQLNLPAETSMILPFLSGRF